MEGNGRILTINGSRPTDAQGRVLKHNATIEEVYQIAAAEAVKVNEFYLDQIPAFVARMIQDALISYGLVVIPEGTDIRPASNQTEAVSGSPETRESISPEAETADSVATIEQELFVLTKRPFEESLTGSPANPQKIADVFLKPIV
jgi:hypothetical protein